MIYLARYSGYIQWVFDVSLRLIIKTFNWILPISWFSQDSGKGQLQSWPFCKHKSVGSNPKNTQGTDLSVLFIYPSWWAQRKVESNRSDAASYSYYATDISEANIYLHSIIFYLAALATLWMKIKHTKVIKYGFVWINNPMIQTL